MKTYFFPALRMLFVLTILTGILYPALITLVAVTIFPRQANGSMIFQNGNIVGSELIGQNFSADIYFWPRPSAIDYNPMPSSGSNVGPTSRALQDSTTSRKIRFIQQNYLSSDILVPKEMLFASASGLDPHISPKAALLQIRRVMRARRLDSTKTSKIDSLVRINIESPQWNIFGQERVNVLKLNLALDRTLL